MVRQNAHEDTWGGDRMVHGGCLLWQLCSKLLTTSRTGLLLSQLETLLHELPCTVAVLKVKSLALKVTNPMQHFFTAGATNLYLTLENFYSTLELSIQDISLCSSNF